MAALKHDWYPKSYNRQERNKKSIDWIQDGHKGSNAMMRGPPRISAPLSLLTGHRAGAGAFLNDTPIWPNLDDSKGQRRL